MGSRHGESVSESSRTCQIRGRLPSAASGEFQAQQVWLVRLAPATRSKFPTCSQLYMRYASQSLKTSDKLISFFVLLELCSGQLLCLTLPRAPLPEAAGRDPTGGLSRK